MIFGNGLGRSIDSNFYQLEKALLGAWADPAILNEQHKELILKCLPVDVLDANESLAPKSEDELDILQKVLAACDEISKYETGDGSSWLTQDGKEFPIAIRRYIHRAASYFHRSPHVLPNSFVNPLVQSIIEERHHVTTLNYDDLLYRAFIGTSVFNGYSCLLDGFVGSFDPSNLERNRPSTQAYYLHLHGSPLYYNKRNGDLHKSNLSDLPLLEGYSSTHLVLTHVDHKASVIAASPILREYWSRLEEAMKEAEGVVLFGYGGGDRHLNLLISKYFREKQVEIVERQKLEYNEESGKNTRFQHWQKLLGVEKVYIWWHDSIISHAVWDWKR